MWYSIQQESPNDLCTDVYYSGVFIRSGKVVKESEDSFILEGLDKILSAKSKAEATLEKYGYLKQ